MSIDSDPLELSLRRDRGYVYLPDAIQLTVGRLSPQDMQNLRSMSFDCFRKTSKKIIIERLRGRNFKNDDPDLFAAVQLKFEGRDDFILLREADREIENYYEFVEPVLDLAFTKARVVCGLDARQFPTYSHLFAVLCKRLFYKLSPESNKRLLLQRLTTTENLGAPVSGMSFEARLDFQTKEDFCRFSLVRDGMEFGSAFFAAVDIK